MKFSIGRPRPNFFALMDLEVDQTLSVNHKQARMSFPSGHAALCFSTLFLLTLNLFAAMRFAQSRAGKLRVSMNRPHCYFYLPMWWTLRFFPLFSVLLVASPCLLAMFVACTRVTDYWHHYADIAVGSLLGIVGSIVAFVVIRGEFEMVNGAGSPIRSLIMNDSEEHMVYAPDRMVVSPRGGKTEEKMMHEALEVSIHSEAKDRNLSQRRNGDNAVVKSEIETAERQKGRKWKDTFASDVDDGDIYVNYRVKDKSDRRRWNGDSQ